MYFKNKVAENRHDPKKLWRLIRELDGKNACKVKWQLIDGDKVVTDKQQIAEMFNSYFTGQPKLLVCELINATGNYIFPEQQFQSQFGILPEQINDFINQIPVDKATGPDGVGVRLLKMASPTISELLSRIINHCITTGKFPAKWKVVSVFCSRYVW